MRRRGMRRRGGGNGAEMRDVPRVDPPVVDDDEVNINKNLAIDMRKDSGGRDLEYRGGKEAVDSSWWD